MLREVGFNEEFQWIRVRRFGRLGKEVEIMVLMMGNQKKM